MIINPTNRTPQIGDIIQAGRKSFQIERLTEIGYTTIEITSEYAALLQAAQRGADAWAKWENEKREAVANARLAGVVD
jgi:hypothetical protein